MDAPLMQIVENHAEIAGELVAVAPDPARPGFVTLTVKVSGASAVGDWPNFFERDVGGTIAITARRDSPAATAEPRSPLRLRVKKTGPGQSFAED